MLGKLMTKGPLIKIYLNGKTTGLNRESTE